MKRPDRGRPPPRDGGGVAVTGGGEAAAGGGPGTCTVPDPVGRDASIATPVAVVTPASKCAEGVGGGARWGTADCGGRGCCGSCAASGSSSSGAGAARRRSRTPVSCSMVRSRVRRSRSSLA